MPLFARPTVPVLGIDISAASVKVLELGARGDNFRVDAYAVVPLPAEAMVEKNISNVEAVSGTLAKAVKQSGTKLKHGAVAVAGSSVITKVITMPANISESELELQVEVEAEQHIPFPLEEVHMDFEIVGPTEGNPEQVDVLLAASRSENVDNRVMVLEQAGLIPKIVDIETLALENTVAMMMEEEYGEESAEGQVVAVADIGAGSTVFSVLKDMRIMYSREDSFGGNQLTEKIQEVYGLSYEEADMAKKQGGLPDNYEAEVLEPFKKSMAQQIGRMAQFFYSASHVSSIDYLLLSGGSVAVSGIGDLVEEQVSIPTTIANPFAKMKKAARVSEEQLTRDAPSLMICCGLALRSFD